MLATTANLDRVTDLASQLSPREQLELLVRIGQGLGVALEQPTSYLAGSAAAVLQAASQPPHVDDETVKEMEIAIAQGRRPARSAGEFDHGDAR